MTRMSIEEAHVICQDTSSTLEQAYGMSKARMVFGFWGAASYPKHARKIFSAPKTISVAGTDAAKVCAFLSSTMPGQVHTFTESDVINDPGKVNFTCLCNRPRYGVFHLTLDNSTFDPWPHLKETAAAFSAACVVVKEKILDFDSIHRSVLMNSMELAPAANLYAQACLSWAGWGAFCLGQGYTETSLPIADALVSDGKREVPDYTGVIAFKHDWMIITSACAGRDVRKLCPPRRIQRPWEPAKDIEVCEIFLDRKTKWIFEIAHAMDIAMSPTPKKPASLNIVKQRKGGWATN